jgi:putative ABC transport system permease protein
MVVVAGLSLGLGVGSTTTMYGVVNRVSNYELGFPDADRLTVLWTGNAEKGIRQQPPNWEIVQAILEHGHSFESFGFFQAGGAPVTMTGTTESSRVSQMPVDVNGLSIVGVKPALGRTYRLDDFDDGVKQKEARAIVISHDTWQQRLGGAADVVGTSIHVDGEPRTIIGVMPKGFTLVPWEDNIAFWIANDLRKIPEARWMIAIGRLKPGVSLASAQAEATVITRQVVEARGEKPGGTAAEVVLLHDAFFADATKGTTFILGAVSFVLLIACANVANLLLAAGTARQKELAVRAATGARRGRLMQQLLTENLLLSLVGCGFGLALAFWGTRLFALIVPVGFPELLRHISIDARVLGFAFAISLFTTFGRLAILLAMVGVYGVMSWVVGQRTTEFGIRMALGARARDVVAMLMTQSLKPILIGVVLGVAGGYGLSRALNSMF